MLYYDEPILLLCIFVTFLHLTLGRSVSDNCELITVKFCKSMPYNYTKLPNSLNHRNQDSIDKLLNHFDPLIQIECSENLQKFLCSLYVPICNDLDKFILPCRDLCMDTKTKCEKRMLSYGYKWPENLECSKFAEKPTEEDMENLCIPLKESNDTGFDSTDLLFSYKDVDSKEIVVDTTFSEPIILLLSTWHQILLYDIPIRDTIPLHTGLEQGASIDFYYKEKLIFWAEEGDGRIQRASLTLDVFRDIREIVDASPANVESITVDWITRHLLWLESYPASLKASKLDGSDPTVIYTFSDVRKVPKFLVIDPIAGYLFWIDSEGDLYAPGACIERFNLKNNERSTIFNISKDELHNMGRPKGLTLDMKAHKIYWTDARSESLQCTDYDGQNFQILVTNPNYLGEPLALSVYKTNLFWSDRDTKSIGKIDLKNGKKPSFIESLIESPATDLKVFHKDVQQKGKSHYTIRLEKSKKLEKSSKRNGACVSYGNCLPILTVTLLLIICFR
ncbi:low-density lipoprotein receptor-related protein 1B-like [Mytilus galloprovincialis]|uniref:low-density lipoprotein receptor-related protein 1B-like n=1 Tax=Mytilus galloprovincialis TaxID=29158 RepID=UPI003F7C90CD